MSMLTVFYISKIVQNWKIWFLFEQKIKKKNIVNNAFKLAVPIVPKKYEVKPL